MRNRAENLGVSRSNLIAKLQAPRKSQKQSRRGDDECLIMIREIIEKRPTYVYRRVAVLVNGELKKRGQSSINRKRIYRLMKQNHFLLQKPVFKPQRSHDGKVQTLMSNMRWCSDTFAVQCENGEKVHVAFSIDTCDREVMRYLASTIGID